LPDTGTEFDLFLTRKLAFQKSIAVGLYISLISEWDNRDEALDYEFAISLDKILGGIVFKELDMRH